MPLDDEAVARIYHEHAVALRRFVIGATGNAATAEDVVQETILRVWRQAPVITTSLRGYLFRTARNIMVDAQRAQARRPRESPGEELELVPAAASRIDEMLNRVLMEEALARLSPEHRDVVVALHYRGLTTTEAALALRIPPGTVKSRAFYAVRSLKEILLEMGVNT